MSAKDALIFAQQQRIAHLEAKLAEPPKCRVSFMCGCPGRWGNWRHFYTSEKEFQQLRAALSFDGGFGQFITVTELEEAEAFDNMLFLGHDIIRNVLETWNVCDSSAYDRSTAEFMLAMVCSIYRYNRLLEYKPMFDKICKLYPQHIRAEPYKYVDTLNILIEYD